MPNKEFLEEYPLYRRFMAKDIPITVDQFPEVRINMPCPTCASYQTFVMTNKYHENQQYANYPAEGLVLRLAYLCIHCQTFERVFFVRIDDKRQSMMKVGQFPPWEVEGDQHIERMLGAHFDYYKKGLVCESQGYGIGAFGYYRRIVEEYSGPRFQDSGLSCALS